MMMLNGNDTFQLSIYIVQNSRPRLTGFEVHAQAQHLLTGLSFRPGSNPKTLKKSDPQSEGDLAQKPNGLIYPLPAQ